MLVAIWYATASVITFLVYAIDKSAARQRTWRTPERTLHLLALATPTNGMPSCCKRWTFPQACCQP
jgi:uncharacterized membrane protein YsdA (DUF1294 family)